MLYQQIRADLTAAMKSKDRDKSNNIRYIISHITTKEKEVGTSVEETDVVAILKRLQKQCKNSIEKFTEGNRQDLIDHEMKCLEVVESYIPKQLDRVQIETIVLKLVAE